MATRKETSTRKQALHEELRVACRNGTLPPGEPLPSVRDLAGRYSVSHRLVNDALRTLMQEGLLYSVPRQGTFVGSPNLTRESLFLLYTPTATQKNDQLARLRYGFEEQITRLGGTCLMLSPAMARSMSGSSGLNPAGVFFVAGMPNEEDLAYFTPGCQGVFYQDHKLSKGVIAAEAQRGAFPGEATPMDRVSFDNVGAGNRVSHYLLGQGHKKVAFLGLHGSEQETGHFGWSRERASGWQRVQEEGRCNWRELLFLPDSMPAQAPSIDNQLEIGFQVGQQLARRVQPDEITAVVTVNVHSSYGLLRALQESELPEKEWPVITTFGMGAGPAVMMTSMLLPWEQMGREAAELLWSRHRGTYQGPARHVSVPMSLITRLTCRPQWRLRPEAALFSLEVAQYLK